MINPPLPRLSKADHFLIQSAETCNWHKFIINLQAVKLRLFLAVEKFFWTVAAGLDLLADDADGISQILSHSFPRVLCVNGCSTTHRIGNHLLTGVYDPRPPKSGHY